MTQAEERKTRGRARAALARTGRRAGRLGLALLVLLALYVSAGRLLAPYAAGQKDNIEELLSRRLGTEVSIGSLDVGWRHFSPLLSLRELRIQYPASAPAAPPGYHEVDSLEIRLDVPRSLWRRQWVTSRVDILAPALELVETEAGRWALAGFGGGDAAWREAALDLLLNAAFLRLEDASLALRPAGGEALVLREGSLEVRNQGQSHQLRLEAILREGREPLRLALDLEGDPRAEFAAALHADVRLDAAMTLAPVLHGLGRLETGLESRLESLDGRARLWAWADRSGLQEVRGMVENLELRAAGAPESPALALSEGSSTFHLRRMPEAGRWQLWLEEPRFALGETRWNSGELFLDMDFRGAKPVFDLQAASLGLGPAADLLLALDLLPAGGAAALRELDPQGLLRKLRLHADLAEPEALKLHANLEDVAVQAWKAAPAAAGVSGYLESGLGGGFVELDAPGFSLHLPRLFHDPWHYSRANSRVYWSLAPGDIEVSSGVIDARGEDIHGRVQFALDIHRNGAGLWETDLDLQVGVLEADAAAKRLYLPILPALAGTMDWLDRAILAGRVEDSGLVLRGHFSPERRPGSTSAQSFFHIEDLSLRYLDEWPRIDGVSGFVRVNDTEAEIFAAGGETAGIRLDPATATLRRNPEGGSWLSLRGSATAGTAQGLDFLRGSPLRENIGPYLDHWKADGNLRVDMNLRIPLAVEGAEPEVQVAVLSRDSSLEMPDQGFLFEDVEGLVNYSSSGGLMAEGLRGRLFGYPVSAGIESFDRALEGSVLRERGTRIHGSGRASVEALAAWPKQSGFVRGLLAFAEGEIDYAAELELFDSPGEDGVHASLSLRSPLKGLAVDLPQPFGREAGEERPLELRLDFREDAQLLSARYGGRFFGNMTLRGGRLDRGMLYFGPLNQEFSVRQSDSDEPGLLVAGELARFNLEAWREVAGALTAGEAGESQAVDALRLVDLNIGRLDAFGHSLQEVNTQLRPTAEGWELSLRNDLLSGDFLLPGDPARPYEASLDYLRFPSEAEDAPAQTEARDALAGVNPARLPAIDFQTAELGVGGRDLGAWRFQLRPRQGGASISGLQVEMDDASISDATGEAGASLEWDFDGESHRSSFTGRFLAGDLAPALTTLGFDAHVESRSASFEGTLAWPGSPAAFALTGSSGDILMDIRDGRFVNIDSGGSRLFGALSFDAIVRRLELDFSDLFGKGFVYDTIEGGLNFEEGILTTHDMVRIEGPSSKISIDGRIDLMQETIDADMLVTLPLSQNLAVVAGLLGAWPLAVSTYMAGKIFEEQMDEFTTLVYRLEGPWESLDGNFEVPEVPATAPPQASTAPAE